MGGAVLLGLLGCVHRDDLAAQFEREIVALSMEKRMLEDQLEGCGHPAASRKPDPLFVELRQVLDGSLVSVEREQGAVVLVARVVDLWSDPYELQLREESTQTVDLLATAIELHPDYRVWIIGHTSDRPLPKPMVPRYRDLVGYSTALAGDLASELHRSYGVDASQIGVAGRGPWVPVRSNDTEDGRAANERIEIWMAPESSPVLPR